MHIESPRIPGLIHHDPGCTLPGSKVIQSPCLSLPGVAKEPAPQVYAGNFAAGAVAFQVRVWTDRYQDWAQVRSDLSVILADALRRENINFA